MPHPQNIPINMHISFRKQQNLVLSHPKHWHPHSRLPSSLVGSFPRWIIWQMQASKQARRACILAVISPTLFPSLLRALRDGVFAPRLAGFCQPKCGFIPAVLDYTYPGVRLERANK